MSMRLEHSAELRRRSTLETPVERFAEAGFRSVIDTLAIEEPLEIQLGYGRPDNRSVKSISVTMRTPGNDLELAAGFLMTEAVVHNPEDIEEIRYVSGSWRNGDDTASGRERPAEPQNNVVRVELAPGANVNMASLQRNFYTTSSCGVCGKASLLALRAVRPPRRKNGFQFEASVLHALPQRLRVAQDIFGKTGGLHAAGLFDGAGALVSIREDVGRHNAVDKLLGNEFLADRTPLEDRLLMLSGRASFELLQKALMGGIPMVVSVGAPSSLAVQVARDFDITLAGFLRDSGFNVYHGAARLTGSAGTEVHFEAAH